MLLFAFSCANETSKLTNIEYNSPETGGYLKANFKEQETGPGLVLIKGDYFNYKEKEVLIPSFYMDEYEVTNQAWVDYLYWTKRVFTDFPLVYTSALPDEKVWLENGAYNEPMVDYYLNHPAYENYPVVGVSWMQANNYCKWRTDRVNEMILIREGILLWNNDQQNEPFTTSAYLAGQYKRKENPRGQLLDLDPLNGNYTNRSTEYKIKGLNVRNVKIQDGILLPKYRLPTSAEWEYASNSPTSKKGILLPWNGKIHKNKSGRTISSRPLNGQVSLLTPTNSFWPNDYGLYCMNSNVSEWVMDSYSGTNDVSNYSPFSGENPILAQKLNSEGSIDNKLDECIYDLVEISNFTKNFIKERTKIKRGYITDSLDFLLLQEVDSMVDICLETYLENRKREASRGMREIIETSMPDLGFRMQSVPGFEDFQYEITPKYMEGISTFISASPGDIRYEQYKAEDLVIKKNRLTPEMIQFIPSLQFDLDKDKNTENRIYKGKNWRDSSDVTLERYLNKYLSSSSIGFRCAMDRLGALKK